MFLYQIYGFDVNAIIVKNQQRKNDISFSFRSVIFFVFFDQMIESMVPIFIEQKKRETHPRLFITNTDTLKEKNCVLNSLMR